MKPKPLFYKTSEKKWVTARKDILGIFHSNQKAFHEEEPENEDLDLFFELDVNELENRDDASTYIKREPKGEESPVWVIVQVR